MKRKKTEKEIIRDEMFEIICAQCNRYRELGIRFFNENKILKKQIEMLKKRIKKK
jgi:hypothetical protein